MRRRVLRLLMAASVLMVSYGKTASKYPLQVHGPSQQRLGAPGHWAPWSAWSPCSRTCGGGVAVQTRDCRPMETRRRRRLTEPPPRSHCVGVYKRVHVCNDQECPPGSKDFRSAQCEAFNGKPFMGRLYLWEPFLQAPNPCELNCRAAGFRFYATLNKTVVDGTPCRGEAPPPARHVCVAGVCQRVGCDGVVGSGRVVDACGVCGGDSSACRRVAGLFTRPTLPPGYNLVATLPRAACNVTVAELRPSRNFLALRRQDGSFILNGDWAVVRPGEYDGFTYRRHDPESITAAGPLRGPVDIMIIYQEPNPGIKYEYMLPMKVDPVPPIPGINPRPNDKHLKDGSPLNGLDKSPAFPHGTGVQATESQPAPPPARPRGRRRKFVWRVTGFSECSQTCGGGVQTAVVQCVREATQQVVPERRCPEKRPPPQTRRCHTKQPCPPQWEAGEWSPCSVSCGRGGSQARSVVCRQQLTADLNMVVTDGACAMTPAPARSQPCDGPPCPGHEPEWRAGPWGECSAPCGQGNRSRAVMCQGPYGQSGEEECPQSDRPAEEEPCNMGPCPETRSLKHSWLYTEWSQQCSQECGTGIQTRRVICSEGRDATCDASSKPEDRRACSSQRHCAGQWFAGPWGQCSCGLGRQTRSVICIATIRGQQRVTHDSSCPHGLKPPAERNCQADTCPSELWFTSDWSQCSRTCGTGEQSREVHCLDEKQKLANNCPEELRPPSRRTCNTHECGTQAVTSGDTEKRGSTHHIKSNDNPVQNNGVNDQAIPDNNGADEVHHKGNDCVDKFPNCHLVVQARLCKYKYYHNNCCHSCRKKF